MAQVGLHRVEPHVGRDGGAVRAEALEGFERVVLGRGADVAALGVENDRDARMRLVNVGDEILEFGFGSA